MRKRVVIIGMGDSGLLAATHLSDHVDVVGISTKACMLSGQELGLRLSRPAARLPVSMIDFQQYRRLDGSSSSMDGWCALTRRPDGSTSRSRRERLARSTMMRC